LKLLFDLSIKITKKIRSVSNILEEDSVSELNFQPLNFREWLKIR